MENLKDDILFLGSIVSIITFVYSIIEFIYNRIYLLNDLFTKRKPKTKSAIDFKRQKKLDKFYRKEFKEPNLRENDFYEETGIRTNDENILRFNALRKFLGYTKWASLREAQDKISFKKDRVEVKYNYVDHILLWLAGSMSLGLFGFIIWFILTFVPLLLNKQAVAEAKVADLWFLLFVFVVAIGYLYFFLYMLRKPVAVYFIKRDVDKFNDEVHKSILKGEYSEEMGVQDKESTDLFQISITLQNKELKYNFTKNELLKMLIEVQNKTSKKKSKKKGKRKSEKKEKK